MKNVLTRILHFLKDHCFGILLLLYLPGWLIVLDLIASFSKVHHSPYVIAALLTVSLVVCAVGAAVRMAREENPELPLSQLAALCDPPVTKSCLNHRLKRLMELAKA